MIFPTDPASILLLLLLGLTPLLVLVLALRVRSGRLPALRALPGIARLRVLFGDVAESGRPLHVATGANQGSAGATTPTAETIGSLLIAQRIAEETTKRGGTVAATSGDIVAHAALRGTLHQAYQQAGASDFRSDHVQLVAQNSPAAYAAGVAARYVSEPMAASVAAGNFGAEALLLTEEGAANGVPQVAAATTLAALPVLALSANATLIGEELWAAEAYLSDAAAPKARLLTHDLLRWLLIVLLLGGLGWQLLALAGILPGLG